MGSQRCPSSREPRVTEDLIIVGAGGFGREAFRVAESVNERAQRWRILGFVDDAAEGGRLPGNPLEAPLLGTTTIIPTLGDVWVVIAVGDPRTRRLLAQRLR